VKGFDLKIGKQRADLFPSMKYHILSVCPCVIHAKELTRKSTAGFNSLCDLFL
jgi:hypothetical protein